MHQHEGQLSRVFANALRGRDIRVKVVAPTATELFFEGKSQELIDTLARRAPMERPGTVEDTVRVVAFLLGEESGWVHGQVLRVNGGMICAPGHADGRRPCRECFRDRAVVGSAVRRDRYWTV